MLCSQCCHPTLMYEAGIDIVGTYWHCNIQSARNHPSNKPIHSQILHTTPKIFSLRLCKRLHRTTLLLNFLWVLQTRKCVKKEILMYSPISTSVINIRSLDGASLSLPWRQTGQKIAVPLLGLFAFRNPTHTPVTHSSVTSQVKNFSYKDKYQSMKRKGKKRKHQKILGSPTDHPNLGMSLKKSKTLRRYQNIHLWPVKKHLLLL